MKKTNPLSILLPAILTMLLGAGAATAAPIFSTFGSIGPNAFGSPSWTGYVNNAIFALATGLSSVGNQATDPTAYTQVTVIPATALDVSGFDSWFGVASPAAPFQNEFGNRLYFGLDIKGNLTRFSLDELSNINNSTNGDFNNSGGFASSTYNFFLVGIDYGVNGMRDSTITTSGVTAAGDDTVYKAGESSSNLVDELIYVGIGNAFDVDFDGGVTNQNKLDIATDYVSQNFPYQIENQYCLTLPVTGSTCSSNLTVTATPEPGTLLLLSLGLGWLVMRQRSKIQLLTVTASDSRHQSKRCRG